MDKLLNAKSPTFPLDLRSDRMGRCDSILHAAVYAENYETTKSILDFIPGPSDEAKNWLTPGKYYNNNNIQNIKIYIILLYL